MSKPTLEERVEALEASMGIGTTTDGYERKNLFGIIEESLMAQGGLLKRLDEIQCRQELELCRQNPAYFTAHYAAVKTDRSRIPGTPGGDELAYTSDPQEPYRLDTKPKPLMTIDLDSRVVLGDTESRSAAENFRRSSWNMEFDPQASPKGIPFSVALEYMKAGRRVRRGSRSIWIDGGVMVGDGMFAYSRVGSNGATGVDKQDLLANDWEVIPEP